MATLIAVFFVHIGLTTTENGTLLVVDNQEIDFLGSVNNKWNRFTRNCNAVSRLSPNEERYQIAHSLIQNYSPPDSKSAMIASAWSADTWTLVEVEFAGLLPAVVIIKQRKINLLYWQMQCGADTRNLGNQPLLLGNIFPVMRTERLLH